MHKAQKEIRKLLPGVDLFIEVLDARVPYCSENPLLREIRADKPCIKLLHKADLADPVKTSLWSEHFEKSTSTTVARGSVQCLASTIDDTKLIASIPARCHELVVRKTRSERPLHVLIVGIPNVGKSTLINKLAGRAIAKTGNEPAITKGQQKIDIGQGVVLLDTPGVLWANLEHPNTGYRLATLGSIRDTAMDYADVAYFAASFMLSEYPAALMERYGDGIMAGLAAGTPADPHARASAEVQFLEQLGRARGCLSGQGQIDFDRAARLFLNDLRDGTIGRITLETPQTMQNEMIELEKIRSAKAEKKNKRQKKRNKK